MPLPDVVIAGAAKCGTTALAVALDGHKDFGVGTEKEPRFFTDLEPTFCGPLSEAFNRTLIRSAEHYAANFDHVGKSRTVDASTDYLNHPQSARAIHEANPDARIIIGIRHPVHRAWSEHLHLKRVEAEHHTFDEALRLEEERRRAGWVPLFAHVERSRYAEGVGAFLADFGRGQVFVYRHEDLVADPEEVLRELSLFLGAVPPLGRPGRHNVGGMPRSRVVNAIIRSERQGLQSLRRAAGSVIPAAGRERVRRLLDQVNLDRSHRPSPEACEWILSRTADDVADTEALVECDLSAYRTNG